jgi:hypothetical protein
MGLKTLPTIWGTYMKRVTKYQISAINTIYLYASESSLSRVQFITLLIYLSMFTDLSRVQFITLLIYLSMFTDLSRVQFIILFSNALNFFFTLKI